MKLPGYRKRGNSFWRVEGGFYRLIHIQKGAYGAYCFVNVALHPQGFPLLQRGPLCLPEHPKEYECLLRERLEQISERARERQDLGHPPERLEELLTLALPEVEAWFAWWSSREALASASFEDLTRLFSTVPILWRKEFELLKAWCAEDGAQRDAHVRAYQRECPDLDFGAVDSWLKNLP